MGAVDRPSWRPEAIEDDAPARVSRRGPEPRIGDPLPERSPTPPDAEPRRGRGPEPRIETDQPPLRRVEEVDRHFPGLYDRSESREVEPTDSLRMPEDWAAERNPGYPADLARWFNCGDCTRASEVTWRGLDTQAGKLADPKALGEGVGVMDAWSSGERTPTDFDGIKERLESLGPGSSALVAGWWSNRAGGHWFNAVNDTGTIKAVDGQSGRSEPWPPTNGDLGFDEGDFRSAEAIFIDRDGRHLRREDGK